MRGVLYGAIICGLFFVPLKRVNVADLAPVQAVAIYRNGNMVTLETDEGAKGSGTTVDEALQMLKESTSSVIYLDTAQYLIVDRDAQSLVQDLRPHLRSCVKVYVGDGRDRVSPIAQYVSVHKKLPELKEWKPG